MTSELGFMQQVRARERLKSIVAMNLWKGFCIFLSPFCPFRSCVDSYGRAAYVILCTKSA